VAWLYNVARRLFRRSVDLYFVEVQVAGEEHVPAEGPVLLCSNHPNSIMDTVVLGAVVRRPIAYLARSGLFGNPVVGWLLRSAGAIPVYRRQDGPGKPGGNEDAFRAAFERLREGGVVGIFPEGRNAPVRHVRDIKTGAARIALGATERGDPVGVQVVPVGLNYEDRDRFNTRVLVRFGPPIDTRDYLDEDDERGAARALTDELQTRMRAQAVHVHDEARTELLHAIQALYGEDLQAELYGKVDVRALDEKLLRNATARSVKHDDLKARFDTTQWIANAIEHFERREPERLASLERRVVRYETHLRQLRLRADFADRPAKSLSARRDAILLTLYAILLAPVAAWGLVHNFVPYRLTRRFGLAAPEEAIRAVRFLGGGMLFFGLTYAFVGASVYGGAVAAEAHPWRAVAIYLLTLPIAGFWFLRYRFRLAHFAHRILVRTLFRTRRRLLRGLLLEREQLLIEVAEMRRAYEESLVDESAKARDPAG